MTEQVLSNNWRRIRRELRFFDRARLQGKLRTRLRVLDRRVARTRRAALVIFFALFCPLSVAAGAALDVEGLSTAWNQFPGATAILLALATGGGVLLWRHAHLEHKRGQCEALLLSGSKEAVSGCFANNVAGERGEISRPANRTFENGSMDRKTARTASSEHPDQRPLAW